MKIKKERVVVILLNFILLLCLVFNMFMKWNNSNVDVNWAVEISIYSLFLLSYQALIMYWVFKIKCFDFLSVFILLEYIFLYGRIWIKAMGKDDLVVWHLFNAFDDAICYKAALFCLAYSQAIFLGCFMFENKVSERVGIRNDVKFPPIVLYKSGLAFFALTFPVKLYYNIVMISAQRMSGSYIATGVTNGVITAISYLPVIGLIMILCSKKLSKRGINIVFFFYLIYEAFYMILSGDRRQDFIGIITWIICYIDVYNIKVNINKMMKWAIPVIVVMVFLATIKNGRMEGFNSISDFVILFENVAQSNLFIEILGEFGGTFFTVANVVQYYPSELSFLGGLSVVSSILIIIPGIMTALFPNLFYITEINYRCKDFNGLPTGGSLPQDIYANWGMWGILFAIFLGVIIAKFMSREKSNNLTGYGTAVYYAKYSILLNLVRAGTIELGRPLAYSFILIYILGYCYRRHIKNKKDIK